MFHPLEEDLSELSIDEVEKKLNELSKKYNIAARFGNHSLLTQIATFVTIYKQEINERYAKQMKDQQEQANDINKLINVD